MKNVFCHYFVQDEGACMVAGVSGSTPVLVDHYVQVDKLILGPTIRNHGQAVPVHAAKLK